MNIFYWQIRRSVAAKIPLKPVLSFEVAQPCWREHPLSFEQIPLAEDTLLTAKMFIEEHFLP